MSEDIVKESIKCLANMEIKETTYQVARSVVLEEIERLQRQKEELQVNGLRQETLFKLEIERLHNIIKEVREYIGSKEHYEDDFDTEIEKVYKILDKENK